MAARRPPKKKKRCRTVVDKRTGRRRRVCRPKRKPKPRPRPPVRPTVPPAMPGPAVPPPTTGLPAPSAPSPAPPADPPRETPVPEGLPRQATFGPREAERLLWRAGFGPLPGQAEQLGGLTLEQAVLRLTRPTGEEEFAGPVAVDSFGDAYNRQRALSEYAADVVWWFDRMVRTTWPLAQRMSLIWHDWFATADRQIIGARRMLLQHDLFREEWLGNFRRLAHRVTVDEAMLLWLNGLDNEKGHPNENYGRELMELFTLGADRGAYTETDVRELARVLTGYHATWSTERMDLDGFGFVLARHDTASKTLWAGTAHERAGAFGWRQANGRWECDAVDLCIAHPFHPSFFVRKLWSYFVSGDPPAATQALLEQLYVESAYEVRPVVEAILMHPDLYADRRLVKPPAVFAAGLLRSRAESIRRSGWDGVLETAGQRLFNPPDVAGWRDQAWLDTNTLLGRANLVELLLRDHALGVDVAFPHPSETAAEALDRALEFWGRPELSAGTRDVLLAFAENAVPVTADRNRRLAQRMNALRYLVAVSPDHQTC